MSTARNASHVQYIRLPRKISFSLPRANPLNRRMLSIALSGCIEVEEPWYGIQFLFQDQHALVFDDVTNLAVGIEDVAGLGRPHGADLDTGRIPAFARTLDTERALLHYALRSRAVAEVVGVGVDLAFGNGGRLPIEIPRAVGAG